MIETAIIDLTMGFIGSMLALVAWFHFDLEGYWQHKKHQRALRIGERNERRVRKAAADHYEAVQEFHKPLHEERGYL